MMGSLDVRKRVLYVGHCYYNTWYLSRALRKMGWRADTLNVDPNPSTQMYYHGSDHVFEYRGVMDAIRNLWFFVSAVFRYDIFHFSGAHHLHVVAPTHGAVSGVVASLARRVLPSNWEVRVLRRLGKKIVYSNNGCLDGVAQSSFRKWGPEPVCDICVWRDVPRVCSDDRNLAWGKLRNELTDYQVLLGGNRRDFNIAETIHEVPEFYCLDPDFWDPELLVPSNYRLPLGKDTVKIYHAVGNFQSRTSAVSQRNIKSTHIYVPVIERLKAHGYDVELIFFHDVPNTKLRYYQAQADIVVDMLTFGFFGATVREAMMLGKPVVCYLRPEWLESMRQEIPEYCDELPVISATPQSVESVLSDLISNPERRREIGRRSRAFAVKWHSSSAGARRFDQIYRRLLGGT